MERYIALDSEVHRNAGWIPYAGYHFAGEDPLAAVAVEEVPHMSASLPLAFRQLATGRFQLVAVQALSDNDNVCISPEGRWLPGYVPACYRSYPFRLLPIAKDKRRFALCVDARSDLWQDDARYQGERFFTDDGKMTSRIQQVQTFLTRLTRSYATTEKTVNTLAKAGLVQPWRLKRQDENGETQTIQGLYHIDECALRELSGEALSQLASSGALSLAYSQLFSEHRLSVIEKLYALRREAHSADAFDPESLFDEGDDLTFNFDD